MKRITTLEVTSARWQNRMSPAHLFPQQQKYGSHSWTKVHLWELWDPGRSLQNLVESKTGKGWFEEARLCPGGRLANSGPFTGPETALSPCGLSYSSVWPWSCHGLHPPRDPRGVPSTWVLGKRTADIDTVLVLLSPGLGVFSSAQGLASRHTCACSWRQTCWLWSKGRSWSCAVTLLSPLPAAVQ